MTVIAGIVLFFSYIAFYAYGRYVERKAWNELIEQGLVQVPQYVHENVRRRKAELEAK